MTRKQLRATMIGGGVVVLSLAAVLMLFAMRGSIVFFYTPSDLASQQLAKDQRFRLGGLVADGSVKRAAGTEVSFAVTDTIKTIPVTYNGILPDLFREGQGVVATGSFGPDGQFTARQLLAKHDENYQPRELKPLEAGG